MSTLTEQERLALRDAIVPIDERGGGLDPWKYGSTTIGRLKKAKLIEPVVQQWKDAQGKIRHMTVYRATDAGRAMLVQDNPLSHAGKIVAVSLGIGLLGVAGVVAVLHTSERIASADGKVARVALLGDSLAVGLGPEMAKLAKASGTDFRYYGKSGTTVKQWLDNHWLDPVIAFAPDIYIVSLGANDLGYSPAPPRSPYEQLRDQLLATGARVLWVEPLGTKMSGPNSVVDSLGVETVPPDASVPLASDGVHGSGPAAYAQWAKMVWQHV